MIWALVLLFFILVFLGIPVSFSMAIVSLLGLWAFDLPLMMMIQKMHSGNDQFPFLAVPFFILAGMLMETGGISLRLVNLARGLVGHMRGGLGMVAVVSEVFFSGISGSSLADASAIGSMMLPALRNGGYSKEHSVCIISAATGMGMLIPPCLNMLVLAAITNLSVAALFLAGFLPGFFMAIALMAFIYYQSRKGILPGGEEAFNVGRLGRAAVHSVLPMMMPVIIFGGILGGVATATEAAVLAVAYALIVGTPGVQGNKNTRFAQDICRYPGDHRIDGTARGGFHAFQLDSRNTAGAGNGRQHDDVFHDEPLRVSRSRQPIFHRDDRAHGRITGPVDLSIPSYIPSL